MPVKADEVEIGDQILSPYGYRVVHDIQPDGPNLRFYFWDDEPITRSADPPASTFPTKESPRLMPTTYSHDEMTRMLVTGANALGRTNVQAAVHLITATGLPHLPAFTDLIVVETVDWQDGPIQAAYVKNWAALPYSPAAEVLSTPDRRLLTLAVSLAAAVPVDLSANLFAAGYVHARRIVEAVTIAIGYADYYEITRTAKLDQLIADHAAQPNA